MEVLRFFDGRPERSLDTQSVEANEYDLIVIRSGPAGQKAAICAAKLRKKVAIIDRKRTIGGVCVHTGTIPGKTLREAVLYLSGFRQRTFYGGDMRSRIASRCRT